MPPKTMKTVVPKKVKDPPSIASKSETTKKASTGTSTSTATPKSVLEKIVRAVRQQPPSGATGGVSRQAITKYLKAEFDYDNANAVKVALKRGVSTGVLVQTGQSFRVKDDPVRQPEVVPGDEEPLQIINVKSKAKAKVKGSTETKANMNDETAAIMRAERGDVVTVNYIGTLKDGTQFDAAKSFTFMLGAGDVIKGWDQGLIGMTVGSKRKLVVPSRLGYGKRGSSPDIPPNATLHFDITMKKIVKSADDE
jgi:hypothetical protein